MDRRREVLRLIAEDAETDAKRLDGQPFNGLMVGSQFGNVFASIKSLAKIMETLLPEEKE